MSKPTTDAASVRASDAPSATTSPERERRPLSQYILPDAFADGSAAYEADDSDDGWAIFDSADDDPLGNVVKPRLDVSVLKRIKSFLADDETAESSTFLDDGEVDFAESGDFNENVAPRPRARVAYPFYDGGDETPKPVVETESSAPIDAPRTSESVESNLLNESTSQTAKPTKEIPIEQVAQNANDKPVDQTAQDEQETQNAEIAQTAQDEQETQNAEIAQTAQDEQETQNAEIAQTAQDEQETQNAEIVPVDEETRDAPAFRPNAEPTPGHFVVDFTDELAEIAPATEPVPLIAPVSARKKRAASIKATSPKPVAPVSEPPVSPISPKTPEIAEAPVSFESNPLPQTHEAPVLSISPETPEIAKAPGLTDSFAPVEETTAPVAPGASVVCSTLDDPSLSDAFATSAPVPPPQAPRSSSNRTQNRRPARPNADVDFVRRVEVSFRTSEIPANAASTGRPVRSLAARLPIFRRFVDLVSQPETAPETASEPQTAADVALKLTPNDVAFETAVRPAVQASAEPTVDAAPFESNVSFVVAPTPIDLDALYSVETT